MASVRLMTVVDEHIVIREGGRIVLVVVKVDMWLRIDA